MHTPDSVLDGAGPAVAATDPGEEGTIRNWGGNPPPHVFKLEASAPAPADEADPAAGPRFPGVGESYAGFELVSVLGRGTFGRVYLARQGNLADRYVALKMSPDLTGESRTLARLQHTNIVPVYSVHRSPPFQAVCMPYFGATTLGHLLVRYRGKGTLPETGLQLVDTLRMLNDETATTEGVTGPVGPPSVSDAPKFPNPPADASGATPAVETGAATGGFLGLLRSMSYTQAVCWIGEQLADGLAHAHWRGTIHNDLKPANILLTDDGQPMLLDFGMADDLATRSTTWKSIGGTLSYMSPEHLEAVRTRTPGTDGRSDIYSLGIILFECLTGRPPFRLPTGTLDQEVPQMLAERRAGVPRLRPLNPAVSPGLEAIILKCLEVDPARRYQSASDLKEDLARHRQHAPLRYVRVPSVRERLAKWARRHPRLASNASVAAAAVVVIGLLAAWLNARAERLNRFEALETARELNNDLAAAAAAFETRSMSRASVETGVARCESALSRYGLPGTREWTSHPAFRSLPGEEQERVRGQLLEACLMLARGYAAADRFGLPDNGRAEELNHLAERIAGPEVPRAVLEQRAELLKSKRKLNEAGQAAEQAKAAPLKSSLDYYLAGAEDLAEGRFREARARFARAVELDPASYRAHLGLGQSHEGMANYSEAASAYSTAIALRPDAAEAHRNRGYADLRLQDFARARADLDRAVERAPDHADTYLNRSLAHLGLKDYPASVRDLDRAADLGGPAARILFTRSRVRSLAGDKDGAKRDLDAAMKAEPTDDLTWTTRGVSRMAADPTAAIADFDAALVLNPRSLVALQNKAHVLAKLGRTEESIKTLDRILDLYPEAVASLAGRGVMYARLQNWKCAKADAEEALRRDKAPSNVYQIAGIYALLSTQDTAYKTTALGLLRTALRGGFGHDYIETDKDLAPLRDSSEFNKLLNSVRVLNGPPQGQ